MKFLIMAGGRGTRLWPVSRAGKPKQFQKLISDKTMLQETVQRLLPRFSLEDIYVATNEVYADEVQNELPALSPGHIIAEPSFRERASAIALSCAVLGNEDEILAILPSDHLIRNTKTFWSVIEDAEDFIKRNPETLLAIGIKPTGPETGYGYIKHKADPLEKGRFNFYRADGFFEKPDLDAVKKYFADDVFLWNSGIYVCRIGTILDRFKKFMPDTYARLRRISKFAGTEKFAKAVKKEYPLMDMISFEYGIAEKDTEMAVIAAGLEWSDVGSWSVLKDSLMENSPQVFSKGEHLDIGSKNIMVYGSNKLIATIGLEDIIIVDTEDAILVCNKNNTQLVKDLVHKMEKDGKIKLL